MSTPVALYTLGQTPRPDLVPQMAAALNAPDIKVFGVLDDVPESDIREPLTGNYPLKTRLSDGREIRSDCEFLQPRLQRLIEAHDYDVVMHIVLSVAPFRNLHAEGILIRPFEHGCRTLAARRIHEVCVLVPYSEQVFHAHQKWEAAGFSVNILSVEEKPSGISIEEWVSRCVTAHNADGVVVDFVGYSRLLTTRLEFALGIPVLDLGFEAMDFGRTCLAEFESIEQRISKDREAQTRLIPSFPDNRMGAN